MAYNKRIIQHFYVTSVPEFWCKKLKKKEKNSIPNFTWGENISHHEILHIFQFKRKISLPTQVLLGESSILILWIVRLWIDGIMRRGTFFYGKKGDITQSNVVPCIALFDFFSSNTKCSFFISNMGFHRQHPHGFWFWVPHITALVCPKLFPIF